MDSTRSIQLLNRTARRLRLKAMASVFYVSLLVLAGIYLVALIVVRSIGAVTDWFSPSQSLSLPLGDWSFAPLGFEPIAIFGIPLLAAVVALLWHRRPSRADAARAVDRKHATKDLFLNVALLEGSPGEFRPLVARAAEYRAEQITAAEVVPYRFGRRVGYAFGAILLLLVAAQNFPTFDPFGTVEAAQQVEEQKKELAKSRKATERRLAEVKREQSTEGESEEVAKAIQKLQSTFRKMKPTQTKANFQQLALNQRILGQKWQKLSADTLKELLKQNPMSQQFGGTADEKTQKWMKELQMGSAEALEKELSEMQDELKRLQKEQDPVEREKIRKQLQKRLQDLKNFAKDDVNSKALSAALERAMKQLSMSEQKELSADAMKALTESMELAKVELKELSQSAKDLKELEEALQALQMAKALNEQEKLDGQACDKCQSMAEFSALYEELLAQMNGYGPGMGGLGTGEGNVADEDDSSQLGFKDTQVKTAITAGKTLMTLKTKGVGEKGDAKIEYRAAIRNVRQGASEAILNEQIPPGYHDGIRNYFDSIDNSADESESGQ